MYKKQNGFTELNLDYNKIIFRRVKNAIEMNLKEGFIREIFELIIEETEKENINNFKK